LALAPGTNINQYKIISCLGSGGMGEVYLAQDTRLGRKVALKLLYESVKQDDDWVRRFEHEARATSSLNHPNIITIYEVGQSDGSHFISAEFIDGWTLREHLKQNVLTLREVLDIAIQVATALSTAHDAGIAHRDIKPENVMLRADGYVKVVDFGLAKFIEKRLLGLSDSDPNAETQAGSQPFVNTNPGAVIGTVSYMSPEQARGVHVDTRTDIFSLGVLLYEMLTGRLPFAGSTASEVIVSIIEKKPKPITRFAPDVPLEMVRIVTKALSKNRDERYQTIQDMLIDLKRLRRGLEFEEEEPDETAVEEGLALRRPSSNGGRLRVSQARSGDGTGEVTATSTASSAEYLVRGLWRHKAAALAGVGVIAVALAAFFLYRATRPIDSVAVVPVYRGAAAEDEQFGDDITNELIDGLSQLSAGLRVAPFDSVLPLKGKSPQEVGRELRVQAVLTVDVRRAGETLRIGARLIDLRDDRQIWSASASNKISEKTLEAQKIIAAVSTRLGLKLSPEEEKKKEVVALYMKGRHAWNRRTADDIKAAAVHFNDAIRLDPGYAPAHAALADAHNMLATYGAAAPRDAFPKARQAAEAALKIDNNLAEAHAALAYAKFRGDWDWDGAEAEFREAVRLNPDYASARQWYASYLAAMGRPDEAERETSEAQKRETSLVIHSHSGLMHFFARRYDDAVGACLKALQMNQEFFIARRYLGLVYAQKGMHREAAGEYEKVMKTSRGSPLMRAEYASVLALGGETAKARAELEGLLGMIERREGYISAYQIATVYAALGERESALRWLKRAHSEGADWMVYLNVDPRFDGLRADPEFKDLLQQLKFKNQG
jgi:serine/threonine protein kinase/TolB-like protein/Flp pilus assembly protein TadD